MARGGARVGAGRPKGAKNRPRNFDEVSGEIDLGLGKGVRPLDYMLAVISDGNCDPSRRDRMAVAAAPYCHPKIADSRLGKKDAIAAAAERAGSGTDWGDDLASNVVALRKS